MDPAFCAADRCTAEELMLNGKEYGHDEVDGDGMARMRMLLKSWRDIDVDMMTQGFRLRSAECNFLSLLTVTIHVCFGCIALVAASSR
jgi:hypothetical protein